MKTDIILVRTFVIGAALATIFCGCDPLDTGRIVNSATRAQPEIGKFGAVSAPEDEGKTRVDWFADIGNRMNFWRSYQARISFKGVYCGKRIEIVRDGVIGPCETVILNGTETLDKSFAKEFGEIQDVTVNVSLGPVGVKQEAGSCSTVIRELPAERVTYKQQRDGLVPSPKK